MNGYSPTLALVTAGFELGVAAWAIASPGRRAIKIPVVAILFFLAGYQLLEVAACSSTHSTFWPRVAFADIVWLPALGIWLMTLLAWPESKQARRLAMVPFVMAGALTVWLFVSPLAIMGTICQAVSATYFHDSVVYLAYGGYYQFGLLAMMMLGVFGLGRKVSGINRGHLVDVTVGTIFFVFATSITQHAFPELANSTPSVMCHYAISLALALSRVVYREKGAVVREEVGHQLASN